MILALALFTLLAIHLAGAFDCYNGLFQNSSTSNGVRFQNKTLFQTRYNLTNVGLGFIHPYSDGAYLGKLGSNGQVILNCESYPTGHQW